MDKKKYLLLFLVAIVLSFTINLEKYLGITPLWGLINDGYQHLYILNDTKNDEVILLIPSENSVQPFISSHNYQRYPKEVNINDKVQLRFKHYENNKLCFSERNNCYLINDFLEENNEIHLSQLFKSPSEISVKTKSIKSAKTKIGIHLLISIGIAIALGMFIYKSSIAFFRKRSWVIILILIALSMFIIEIFPTIFEIRYWISLFSV